MNYLTKIRESKTWSIGFSLGLVVTVYFVFALLWDNNLFSNPLILIGEILVVGVLTGLYMFEFERKKQQLPGRLTRKGLLNIVRSSRWLFTGLCFAAAVCINIALGVAAGPQFFAPLIMLAFLCGGIIVGLVLFQIAGNGSR